MTTRHRYFMICSLCCFIVIVLYFRNTSRTSRSIGEDQSVESDIDITIVSKTLVVRRSYFDHRKREGHRNAVVFFVEIRRSLRYNFTGCCVGSKVSSKVHFRESVAYKTPKVKHQHVTKDIAYVDCFDMDGIKDGDSAFLTISHVDFGSLGKEVKVKSQRNVVVPQSRKHLNSSHPSVVTCVSTVRNGEISPSEDGMLYQWLRYQKTIGVDHVHMIAEDTFVKTGGLNHPVIKDALKENFLSIDFWPRWFNETEIFQSSQHLASTDCVYRFQGIYDYIIISDSDDFFVPRGERKCIKHYLKKWCSGKTASCNFEWYQFYPDSGWSPESVGPDGNLTATVHCQHTTKLRKPKSAHQIHALVEVGRHFPTTVMPGFRWQRVVPAKEAYFAHLRKYRAHPKGLC